MISKKTIASLLLIHEVLPPKSDLEKFHDDIEPERTYKKLTNSMGILDVLLDIKLNPRDLKITL